MHLFRLRLLVSIYSSKLLKSTTMRLSDFILLGEEEKKVVVLHEGILIGKRVKNDYLMFLFQMDSYYVETYCNMKSKAIVEYSVFDNTKLLKPYLEAISIDDLLS